MIGAFIVLRKELLELLGNRHSSRGPLVQATVMIVVSGVLLPSMGPAAWSSAGSTAVLFFLFPSALSAAVAADSFAGERERKTLETLLATPLPDHSIFLGKIATAAIFAIGIAALSLACAVATINVLHGAFVPPLELVAGVSASAVASSLFTSALAVGVSMRVAVARSAQQISSLVSLLLVGVVSTVVARSGAPLTWPLVLRIALGVGVVALLALGVLRRLFRRERFFEDR